MLKFNKIALPEVIKRIKHYIPKKCLHIASPRKFYFQLLSQLRRTNTKLSKLMHLLLYRCNAFLNKNIETNYKTILYTTILFVAHFYDNQHIFRNTNYLNISFLWYDFLPINRVENSKIQVYILLTSSIS